MLLTSILSLLSLIPGIAPATTPTIPPVSCFDTLREWNDVCTTDTDCAEEHGGNGDPDPR